MIATSGDRLLAPEAVATLKTMLIPRALLLTPNLPEAAALLNEPVAEDEGAMRAQAERLLTLGARAVLHEGRPRAGSESVDLLIDEEGLERLASPRFVTRNTHGTGCIAVVCDRRRSGQGTSPSRRGTRSQGLYQRAIEASESFAIGRGHGPVHHFHAYW